MYIIKQRYKKTGNILSREIIRIFAGLAASTGSAPKKSLFLPKFFKSFL